MESVDQPLLAAAARKLAREILDTGIVVFPDHALREMANDNLADIDVANVIRGGAYGEAEWENGGWRHHAFTQRIVVVIEFESETELVVVTAWRKK
jgi:Domain of unknown function (DUF4258)